MKKPGFTGYVYDFSIYYDYVYVMYILYITVDDIKDVYKYLMRKNNIV